MVFLSEKKLMNLSLVKVSLALLPKYCRMHQIKFLVRQVLPAVFALRSAYLTLGFFNTVLQSPPW